MERLSALTLKNLWGNTPHSFEENSTRLKKIEYSLSCLCDVVEETQDELEQGELLFGGLETMLENGTTPDEIRKSFRFMRLLSSIGTKLMSRKRGSDGFYLGVFCELRLSKSWHDTSFLKVLKRLFHLVRLKNVRLPATLKEKLLIKFHNQDQKLFMQYFPRASAY